MTEIYDPTPEIVEEINGLITPKLENPAILDGMAGKFRFYYQDLAKLIDSKNQLLAGPQSSVALLIEKALTLENRLYEASIELQTSQTDLNLVTFRFTEKEQKANFPLPIWIRALGVVTRTPENPLNPFTENFEKARQEQFETELIRRYPIEAEKSSFRNHNWVDQFAKDILSKWRS